MRTLMTAVTPILLSLGVATPRVGDAQDSPGPFDVLRGCVAVTPAELRRLDDGHVVAHVLHGGDRDISVFAARRVTVDGDRLLQWVDAIDQLKRSPSVHAIGRFADPPRPGDLASLTFDAAESAALMRCRSGDCAFKLTASERQQIQASGPTNVAIAFRDMLLRRVERYQRGGLAALGRYDDGRTPLSIDETSRGIVARLPCLAERMPELAQVLARDSQAAPAPVLSFYYWSKEEFRERPVLLVTRVVAVQRRFAARTETVVIGRQIYAAHYMNAGLNLTGVIDMPDGRHYLFVLNRSSVDVLGGMFGGVVRGLLERRLRSDVATVIDQVGRRIENGLPVG
jgi:hypothetical protein